METILTIAALAVLLLVIAGVSRWVGKQKPEGAKALPVFVALFLCVFAAVSLSAASQLAGSSSGTTKLVLLVFVVLNALLVRASWPSAEAAV